MRLRNAYAISIGVSRYLHIPILPDVHDAADVAAVLADPSLAGYPQSNVGLLLDAVATRDAILRALDQLVERTSESSTVFLYFSGHGWRSQNSQETCYLMPVDAAGTSESIARTAISCVELSERLRAIRAERVTVVLDCCRASGIAEPKNLESFWSPALSSGLLAPLAGGRGRAVLAASQSDGYAFVVPGQRNGIFTRHLLDGLRGAAQGSDGVIRVFDLFHYVQQRVTAENAAQRPVFKAELEENYPIALYRDGAASRVGGPPLMGTFDYDAFISYRRSDDTDRRWVEAVMIPRLEGLGVRLCLEHRDFRLAQPRVREVERAVACSRYTVAVLTPRYLEGNFEDFQAVLAQHQSWEGRVGRFVPIMRQSCRPSLGARLLLQPLLDFSRDSEVDSGLQRLAVALREPPQAMFDY